LTNKEKYIEFIQQGEYSIFSQPGWWNAIYNEDWEVEIFEVQHYIIYFPHHIEKKYGFTFLRQPILTPYLQFFTSDTIAEKDAKEVYDAMRTWLWNFSIIEIDFHIQTKFTVLMQHASITNIIDTTNEDWEANIKPAAKRQIKFAKKNYSLLEEKNIVNLWTLHTSTCKQNNIKTPFKKYHLKSIFDYVNSNQNGRIYTVFNEEKQAISSGLFVNDHNTMYAIVLANQYPIQRGGMNLVLYHAIQQTIAKGLPQFDFEGSRIESIDTFFKSMGGKEIQVPSIKLNNNKLLSSLLLLKQKIL
jgi:hypothetical protein